MQAYFRLNGTTTHPRAEIIEALRECVTKRGWILDYQRFSNTAVFIRASVSGHGLAALAPELQALGVFWSRTDLDGITRQIPELHQEEDVLLSTHVTFVHDEPDLKIQSPKVPG